MGRHSDYKDMVGPAIKAEWEHFYRLVRRVGKLDQRCGKMYQKYAAVKNRNHGSAVHTLKIIDLILAEKQLVLEEACRVVNEAASLRDAKHENRS